MSVLRAALLLALALGTCAGSDAAAQEPTTGGGFDHFKHGRLFLTCATCHREPADGEGPLWPDPASCATCHDGTVQPRVDWRPPEAPRRSNLRFDHALVPVMTRPESPEPPECMACHAERGAPWMAVQRVDMAQCLGCHGVETAHLAAPDSVCATCHLPLVDAAQLTREDIAAFHVPPSHEAPGWVGARVHGRAATGAGAPVAASCATCHARDFCLSCHVDAPEQAAIQALAEDPRSTAIAVHLAPPASHGERTFLSRHGAAARRAPADCSTCHARESCLACHGGAPRVAAALPARGPGRSAGVLIVRRPPGSHAGDFADRHAAPAARVPASCAGCHVRADCLACHRPDAGAAPGYHPAGFLARHPAAAYARETSCSDCHSTGAFCASCHATAGLRAPGPLRSGYHDASVFFIAGHGGAARQSLETCVACHAERDCLTCHSALGGRRFNPHGPGFDANRLRRKNPEVCTACHGTTIPERP